MLFRNRTTQKIIMHKQHNSRQISFEKRLLKRQKELKTLSRDTAESREPVVLDQQSVGRLSRIDAIQMQVIAQATQRRRELELLRIESTLNRLKYGVFGQCASCGYKISAARLEHDPTALKCVYCAS